jgi:hypothetical protein
LIVSDNGRRKWVLRYQMDGSRRDIGLSSYPAITLREARVAAADARKLILQGIDPIAAREATRTANKPAPTFQEIAEVVVRDAQTKSSNAKARYQWGRHFGGCLLWALAAAAGARDYDPRRGSHALPHGVRNRKWAGSSILLCVGSLNMPASGFAMITASQCPIIPRDGMI